MREYVGCLVFLVLLLRIRMGLVRVTVPARLQAFLAKAHVLRLREFLTLVLPLR
jgi:hypothetical protein